MAKFLIVLCAFFACAVAKPQFLAPLAATPLAAAPVVAPVPAAYAAAPLAYTNLPLDAAYSSSSIDVRHNYGAAVVPASFAAPGVYSAPIAPVGPLKYTAAGPLLF